MWITRVYLFMRIIYFWRIISLEIGNDFINYVFDKARDNEMQNSSGAVKISNRLRFFVAEWCDRLLLVQGPKNPVLFSFIHT